MIINSHKPSNYLVRIFLNYVHLGNIGGNFIGKGTGF